jgi:hypothetical protein
MFCAAHVSGVHIGAPHWLGTPPPPHVCPDGHAPHWSVPPQPSPEGPHATPCAAQVVGTHAGGVSGTTQELRSKIMNSSSFSWAVIGPAAHSAGKIIPFESLTFST